MSSSLIEKTNPNNLYILKKNELEGRLDPYFYTPKFITVIDKLKKANSVTLKSLRVQIKKGIFDLSPTQYCKSGVPFLRVADIKEGGIKFDKTVFISEQKHQDELGTEYFPGDIVISKVGTIGNVSLLPDNYDKYNISQNVVGLRLSEQIKNIVSPSYLQICLQTSFGILQLHRFSTTGVQPKITLDAIRQIIIPVHPKKIQNEIIKKMDSAYKEKKQKEAEAEKLLNSIDDYLLGELGIELIEDNKHQIKSKTFIVCSNKIYGRRLDPIFYSTNLEKFNKGKYSSKKLSFVVKSFISGIGAGKQDQSNDVDGTIQIRPTNIGKDGELKYDKNVYVPSSFKGEKINIGDVLFNNTNSQELVGKTSILRTKKELFFSNHITKIGVNEKELSPDYLMYILNVYQKYKIFYSICTNWNNQSGIGLDLLKSLKIPLPPLSKQIEISKYITGIRSKAKRLQQQAQAELKQAKQDVEAMILGEI